MFVLLRCDNLLINKHSIRRSYWVVSHTTMELELTVPSDGIYYIHTHLHVSSSGGSYHNPTIRVNGSTKLYLTSYHAHSESKSKHSALLQQLRKGDRVHIYGDGYQHLMGPLYSAFGISRSSSADHFGNISNIVCKQFIVSTLTPIELNQCL